MTYDKYCSDCKEMGKKPTLTKKQFNEMQGIEEAAIPVLHIRPKNQRPMQATFDNHIEHGEKIPKR